MLPLNSILTRFFLLFFLSFFSLSFCCYFFFCSVLLSLQYFIEENFSSSQDRVKSFLDNISLSTSLSSLSPRPDPSPSFEMTSATRSSLSKLLLGFLFFLFFLFFSFFSSLLSFLFSSALLFPFRTLSLFLHLKNNKILIIFFLKR